MEKIKIYDPATDPATRDTYAKAQAALAVKSAPAGEGGKPRRAPLTIRTIAEILAMEDSPEDLILENGYIERGERTAICGMGGIGKSRLIMQLAMCHRAGLPFLGWKTRSRHLKWLFLQTENGNRRLRSDLRAMLTGFTPEQREAIMEGIRLHTLEGEDDGFIGLGDPANQERAIEAVQNSGADIVTWDPLRDCAADDLNKDAAMADTLRAVRAVTRAGDPMRTCLVIHHAGEGKAGIAKATGYDRGAFGRNSKVLKTWARAQFNIAPATPDDNSQIIIASGKCNNFAEFSPVSARLNTETMLYEPVEDFDFEAWRESLEGSGGKRENGADVLADIIRDAGGGIEKNEAITRMQAKAIGVNAARAIIKKAVEAGDVEETPHQREGKRSGFFLTLP